jgi:hypothetical protein
MSMAGGDVTIEILKDIRDEIRNTNQRLDSVESTLTHRLGAVESTLTHRLGAVESTLLDLAEQQRFVVRYTKAIAERDGHLDGRVSGLETRVDKLESK